MTENGLTAFKMEVFISNPINISIDNENAVNRTNVKVKIPSILIDHHTP